MTEHRPFWSADQLRDAIERCNADCEAMIANHAEPALIEGRRRGIDHLHKLLENAERQEMAGGEAAGHG